MFFSLQRPFFALKQLSINDTLNSEIPESKYLLTSTSSLNVDCGQSRNGKSIYGRISEYRMFI